MEREIQEIPHSPAFQAPENLSNHPLRRFLSTQSHPHTPLIASLRTSDQTIESAFSRLILSPDFRPHSQTPSFFSLPAALDYGASAESVPHPMAFGERPQALVWAQSPKSNGCVNGPFSFFGAHQGINVGPQAVGIWGTGPNVSADDSLESMKYHRGRDIADVASDVYQWSSLHRKKPFSGKLEDGLPALPSAQKSIVAIPSPSLLYNEQPLNQWHQGISLQHLRGRVITLATDQVGSGVLNLVLERGVSEAEIEMVLPEVMEFLVDLLRNQFGSHFVQNLFVACNEDQRTKMVMALIKFPFKLISICLNAYGGRAMQNLLEKLAMLQVPFVVSALSLGAVILATDPNGQHVIQYCIKHFPVEYNKCLFKEIASNCFKIATNKSGCCVLQSCLDNSNGEAREQLIREIKANALYLAQDPYGNYVVQHLIGMMMQEIIVELLIQFHGYFVSLSCNKYASNVVEKFLSESGENHSATVIMELLTSPNASMLLIDPYGNFVIQSALSASQGRVRDALLRFIQVNVPSMQSNLYGKKILAWLEKRKLRIA